MTDAIIFDIDGTLSDLSHRRHLVTGRGRPDWKTFNALMAKDSPLADTCMLAELLGGHPLTGSDLALFLFTARSEDQRKETEEWLSVHVPAYFEAATLLMRGEGDFRSDTIIKKEMMQSIQAMGYKIRIVVDDRPTVVQMWRDQGITCLAMDPRDFDKTEKTWKSGSLHLMVGPSCAGKSTALKNAFESDGVHIISSDALRMEITGSIGDMDCNDQLFSYVQAAVKARVDHGLITVIDATHIHARSRRPLLEVCPADAGIFYHVYDRPLHEKMRDAGWREAIVMKDGQSLIESHHKSFKGALPTILAGDNDPRVVVFDHRKVS